MKQHTNGQGCVVAECLLKVFDKLLAHGLYEGNMISIFSAPPFQLEYVEMTYSCSLLSREILCLVMHVGLSVSNSTAHFAVAV